jgi:hypothetical protein
MGRAFAGNRFFIDLFRSVAAVAAGVAIVASIITRGRSLTGFESWFVFAQAPSIQTDADVWRGEANQRR